jgi:small subunit ribosomal protein S15
MYLTTEIKKDIFAKHGKSAEDTGSVESQVALFTHRILHLSQHMRENKKDMMTNRSLVRLVGQRRKLLDYLKDCDIERYRTLIKELGLRK